MGDSACAVCAGTIDAPGGTIHETPRFLVDHTVGTLGVGTLVVKTVRHCVHVGDLTPDEAGELGPLLQRVATVVQELARADRVYVCCWSHAGREARHLHFVVQPSWNHLRSWYPHPGSTVQEAMLAGGEPLDRERAAAFAARAAQALGTTHADASSA